MRIMLIDDEQSMHTLIRQIVCGAGYEFVGAYNGEEGLSLIEETAPDLIILDVMLPLSNGFQVCRRIRARGYVQPILFLSARGDIIDKGEGFEAGGSDYMVKPFDPQELLLRIGAHLRQFEAASARKEGRITVGSIDIDVAKHRVSVDGAVVELTAKEFQILFLLASRPGEVFTKEQIVEDAWGTEYIEETSSLPVFIRRIRCKIEKDPSRPTHLITIRNVGYRLDA